MAIWLKSFGWPEFGCGLHAIGGLDQDSGTANLEGLQTLKFRVQGERGYGADIICEEHLANFKLQSNAPTQRSAIREGV